MRPTPVTTSDGREILRVPLREVFEDHDTPAASFQSSLGADPANPMLFRLDASAAGAIARVLAEDTTSERRADGQKLAGLLWVMLSEDRARTRVIYIVDLSAVTVERDETWAAGDKLTSQVRLVDHPGQ
jgi:hypothetical protein